jgi:hypothetical protein
MRPRKLRRGRLTGADSFWRMRTGPRPSARRAHRWPRGSAKPTTSTRTVTNGQPGAADAPAVRATRLRGSTATAPSPYPDSQAAPLPGTGR